MRRPRRAYPSNASATVVLPEPDSPTMPSTSPELTENDTSLTTSELSLVSRISRSRTVSRAVTSPSELMRARRLSHLPHQCVPSPRVDVPLQWRPVEMARIGEVDVKAGELA